MIGSATRLSGFAMAVLALALMLAGCALVSQGETPLATSVSPVVEPTTPVPVATQTPVAPTPTVEATPEPSATVPVSESVTYAPVEIPDAGLALEVPEGWARLEPAWTWAEVVGSELQVGVSWTVLVPPQEPEAVMLPSPSEVVSSDPVELAFGSGRKVVLNVFGASEGGEDTAAPVVAVQAHVLAIRDEGGSRVAYDFFASAPTQEGLATLDAVLQHMTQTAVLQPAGGADNAGGTGAAPMPEAVSRAKAILAMHLGVSEDSIQVGSYEHVDWPDACLGIHNPGQICASVITPGYRVVLSVDGQSYELHTNESGSAVGIAP